MLRHLSTSIAVTFQRVGFHKYPDAPPEVRYLTDKHRHVFKFKVSIEVKFADREIEFHMFLNWLESLYADGNLEMDNRSCETIADELAERIAVKYPGRALSIEVWEDGECGAVANYTT